MGFNNKIQLQAASTQYRHVLQSSIPPVLTVCSSFFERRRSDLICKSTTTTTTTCSEGAQVAGKSNFKKPKLLLPVEEKAKYNAKEKPSKSLFQVILTTSKEYGSGISDLNAGILLAFIGEDGRCFVHKLSNLVSANMFKTSEQTEELCKSSHTLFRFQQGAQDIITFSGPDLGKLEAVWVAPEQGTWRIQDMIVRVFPELLNENNEAVTGDPEGKILQYNFECEEALVGENETTPAAELQISSIFEITREEFLHVDSSKLVSELQMVQVRDEGMREYEALKFSLLSYDALLVIAGSAIASVAGRQEISEGYLLGGILGFLYLFVLERAVDQLPSPSSFSNNEGFFVVASKTESVKEKDSGDMNMTEKSRFQLIESVNDFRAPLTRLTGFLAVFVLIVKIINTANKQALSKEMLFAGAAGFLMTKFATILASNMPFSLKKVHSAQGES